MKIIKPQTLTFESNIPEPDASQGESVYQDSGAPTYSISKTAKGVAYSSTGTQGYRINVDSDSVSRIFDRYTSGFAFVDTKTPLVGYFYPVALGNLPEPIVEMAHHNGTVIGLNPTVQQVMRSTDGGVTWATIATNFVNYSAEPVNGRSVSVNSNGKWFVSVLQGDCYESNDDGLTWSVSTAGTANFSGDLQRVYSTGVYTYFVYASTIKRHNGSAWSIAYTTSFPPVVFSADENYVFYQSSVGGTDIYVSTNYASGFLVYTNDGKFSAAQSMCNQGNVLYRMYSGSNVLYSELSTTTTTTLTSFARYLTTTSDGNLVCVGTDGKSYFFNASNNALSRAIDAFQNADRLAKPINCGEYILLAQNSTNSAYVLPTATYSMTSDYNVNDKSLQNTVTVSNFKLDAKIVIDSTTVM